MTQSCLLGITRCVPQETFSLRPRQVHQGHGIYNKFFNNQACSVKMPGRIVGWLEFEYAKKTLANIQPQSRPSSIAWKDRDEQLIISTFFSSSSLSLFFFCRTMTQLKTGPRTPTLLFTSLQVLLKSMLSRAREPALVYWYTCLLLGLQWNLCLVHRTWTLPPLPSGGFISLKFRTSWQG